MPKETTIRMVQESKSPKQNEITPIPLRVHKYNLITQPINKPQYLSENAIIDPKTGKQK